MVQFHLGENCISFSDDFNKLNTLRTDIIDDMSQFSIYDSMEQLISKHGKMPNIDEVASSFPLMVNQLICEAIVPIIVNFLVENEIYDCSEELFIHRYQERYFNFAKQPQFQNFLSHYVNLANEYMEKRTQKEYNRANRSQWMGGGFGITGAIKGAAQAAVLNAATGVVRGIGDGISDFACDAFDQPAYKFLHGFKGVVQINLLWQLHWQERKDFDFFFFHCVPPNKNRTIQMDCPVKSEREHPKILPSR